MKEKENSNRLYNPDFADGLDAWTIYPPDGVHPVTFAGRTAARCEKRLHSIIAQERSQPLPAGTYVFEYSVVTEGSYPPSETQMLVTVRYQDGTSVQRATNRFLPEHDWETCGMYGITLEKDAKSVSVAVHAHEPDGEPAEGYVYFTGISFRKLL